MKREKLIEIVGRAAVAEEYAFHTGEVHGISAAVRAYPAVWLAPPVVKSKTGRAEGDVVWRLELHLMALPASPRCEDIWAKLERDALSIAGTIACEADVCALGNVSVTPARGSLTAHGEVSVTLRADVTIWYRI